MTGRLLRWQISTGLIMLALASPAALSAKTGSGLEEQPIIRKQLMLLGTRHELNVDFGGTLADSFSRNWMLGISYSYYFDNWIGAGLHFSQNMCAVLGDLCKTALAEDIEATNLNIKDGNAELGISTFGMFIAPHLTIVPMNGKIGLFNKTLHYNTQIIAGGVMATVSSLSGEADLDEKSFGPMIGLNQLFFISDSLAITLSFKDYILSRVLNTNDSSSKSDAEYENNFVLSLGVRFYLPTEAKITR